MVDVVLDPPGLPDAALAACSPDRVVGAHRVAALLEVYTGAIESEEKLVNTRIAP
jgi:hypothetical protein